MPVPHSRRDVLRAGGLLAGGVLLTGGLVRGVANAATTPIFTTMTTATKVAARTDRRPVGGGVYDPTANKTFICWSGKNEDAYVQSYDHAAGLWSAATKIRSGGGDSHNYPTMVQADDGRLLIFVGVHNSQLVVARAPQPHSVSGTWTVHNVPEGPDASYPMPFKTANGTIFVFYRETTAGAPTDSRPLLYVRSTDNGATWKSSKALSGQPYVVGSTKRTDHLNEVYMGQLRWEPATAGRPERVHLVWTIAGGGPSKHLHDSYHKDLYYATFDPAALSFATAAGASLGPQINDADLDPCRVLLTPLTKPAGLKSPDYIQLTGWLDNGRPILLWMTYDTKALVHTSAAVWTGTAWSVREVATGLRVRDMERVAPDTWRVYTNREGTPNIATYLLTGGQDWAAETVITTKKEIQRLEVLSGAKDPARVLASGISTNRSVSVADGDIYVAGLTG